MESDSTINWTEVANNLFHEVSDGFMYLAEKAQEAAPYAWEIAQRQVYAEAITDLMVSVLILSLAIFGGMALRRKFWCEKDKRKCGHYDMDWTDNWCLYMIGGVVAPSILGLVSGIFTLIYLTIFIRVLINPDYYTILKILEMSGLK